MVGYRKVYSVRGEADVYNLSWQRYLDARADDEKRRHRECANAEKKATALISQALGTGSQIASYELNPLYQKQTFFTTPQGTVYATNYPTTGIPGLTTAAGGSMLPILLIGGGLVVVMMMMKGR